MPQANNDGVLLEYDTFGDPADRTLLLIMGYTAQMTAWPVDFCRQLAGRGHHVVRFDNRDCGLSSKTEGQPPDLMAILTAALSGNPVEVDVPYTLSDMAADAVSVLDALDVERAHVAGASMGGMIAQQTAIEHPDRVHTLTSIMSTTGALDVGQPEPQAFTALMTTPPPERDGAIERGVELVRLISGPLFDEPLVRVAIAEAYDRSFYPMGALFQIAAVAKTGDRTESLRSIPHSTLVIHGQLDPLITPSGGEATAKAVPDAELLLLEEMGHNLPRPLWDTIIEAMSRHTASSGS